MIGLENGTMTTVEGPSRDNPQGCVEEKKEEGKDRTPASAR